MPSGLDKEFRTLHEFVKAARIRLDAALWDYLTGGTETETTLRRNRLALDCIAFRPRVLRDVSRSTRVRRSSARRCACRCCWRRSAALQSFEPGGGATVAKGARRSACR